MKLIQSFTIILIFISCSTIGKNTILYGKCKKGYLACNQFELKDDKTFKHYIFTDVGGANVIDGKWEYANGDTLKLNSFKQPKIRKTYYSGIYNEELEGKVRLQIRDFEMPLGFVAVELNNGEITGTLNAEGIGYFAVNKIRNITYSYLGNRKETIEIGEESFNDVVIFVRDIESGTTPEYYVEKLVIANSKEIILNPYSIDIQNRLTKSRMVKRKKK